MTDVDPCDLWLAQAWVELKAPLAQRDALPLSNALDAEAVQDLFMALCRGDVPAAHRVCQRWHGPGPDCPPMTHALGLILPVIEQIEHDWQTDRRSYTDTLYAFWNVQRFLQTWEAPADFPLDPAQATGVPMGRVLIASVPGCQHHLGALVVADLFRTHGWQVQTLIDAPVTRLVQAVRRECPEVIGLSVGHDGGLVGLADLIRSLRNAAPSRPPRIVLGGHVFTQDSTDFAWLGADGIARSAQHALRLCAAWLQLKQH